MSKKTKVYNVEPLRTTEEIEEMKLAIRRGNKSIPKRPALAERDVLVFLIGINTGLRVNDLVRLKVSDVQNKNVFMIREGKTNKLRDINVSMLRSEVESYIEDKHPDSYLILSQKGMPPIS